MKLILTAGALALAAGAADAAVISYAMGGTATIAYANRYAPGGPDGGVDVRHEYAGTVDVFGGSFVIDTSVFE